MLDNLEKKLQRRARIYFYLAILAFIIYSNSLAAPFTLDDFRSITQNHAIRNPLDFAAIWSFYSNRFILYYTLSLDFFFYKFNVLGYHLVNIFIHILNGILVFKIFSIIFELDTFLQTKVFRYRNTIAFLGALMFVGHPVQVNAVTYIIQRTASLAAMFYLMAILYFLKYRLESQIKYFAYMFLSIVLAMFTKENTFSIPFMLLAIETILFRQDFNAKTFFKMSWIWLKENKKHIVLWCVIFLTVFIIPLAKMLQGGSISDPTNSYKASTYMSRYTYLLTEFNVIMTYIRLLFIPVNQNLDYDYPLSHSFFQFPTYISFVLILTILGIAFISRRKNKLISLGILWFFIGISVESSFIAINDVIFEHRLYLSVAGFVLFLAGLLLFCIEHFKTKAPARILIILIISSIAVNFVLTYKRNEIFSNSITLWEDVVKKSPNKWRAHSSLGSNYLDVKEYQKAQKELEKAIELNSEDITAYINLSKLNLELGNYTEALNFANQSIEKNDKSGYGYYYLGDAQFKLGKNKEARESLNKALELDNKLELAYELLGDIDVESKK